MCYSSIIRKRLYLLASLHASQLGKWTHLFTFTMPIDLNDSVLGGGRRCHATNTILPTALTAATTSFKRIAIAEPIKVNCITRSSLFLHRT